MILNFKDSSSFTDPSCKKLLKAKQLVSKAYYDKYGFKMSSSSSSANGGSGGHSSDDDQIALLKKRNFRDF